MVAAWLGALPMRWHRRVFLHGHAALAAQVGLGGIHFADGASGAESFRAPPGCAVSRSCHDVASVAAALGRYDAVFFGPVFPSLSKPGYGPVAGSVLALLREMLLARPAAVKRTEVYAIGGVTAQRLGECQAMGFDGAAMLGAVWGAADRMAAFHEFSAACAPRTVLPSASMEAPS